MDKRAVVQECNEAYSRLSPEAKRVWASAVDQAKAVNGKLLCKVNTLLNPWCLSIRLKLYASSSNIGWSACFAAKSLQDMWVSNNESLEINVTENDWLFLQVYQCQSGHLFCAACDKLIRECPTCRQPLRAKRMRNYWAEQVNILENK